MLTEMLGKGGSLCSRARAGEIHCPLIVRPTSEDVITGHIAQALRLLNPRWWLPDLLNAALGARRFRRQYYRGFRVEPWRNRPCFPRELLPWDEGSTQVDLTLSWENPPTTVLIEAKYGSGLSACVAGDDGSSGYPSDQLIRNIRVGLLEAGYYKREGELFALPPADLVVLVLAPARGHPLVQGYRNPEILRDAIPHADRLIGRPREPFVGEFGYRDIVNLLRRQARWFSRAERAVAMELATYLEFKLATLRRHLDGS